MFQQLLSQARRIPLLLVGESFSFEDALGRTRNLLCSDFQHWEVCTTQVSLELLFDCNLSSFTPF
jgi:hypothetical protein